jgi:hypothetical protein
MDCVRNCPCLARAINTSYAHASLGNNGSCEKLNLIVRCSDGVICRGTWRRNRQPSHLASLVAASGRDYECSDKKGCDVEISFHCSPTVRAIGSQSLHRILETTNDMTLSLSPDIKTRRGQRHEKCFTSRRTPGAPFCWACFASSVKENLAGESVVETAGAVEKPKNGFPTAPWTFGPQFPQRRLLLVLLQTQLFFYSLLHGR